MNRFPFKIGVKLIALLVIYLGSCTKLQNALVQLENTNAILANAVQKLNDQSISWQQTLQDVQSQLTSDAQSTIRNEISNMITRATATAGSEVKCLVDFLRERLKGELTRLIDVNKCNGDVKTVPQLTPHFCTLVPSSINMVDAPDRRNKIEFYGFDFDRAQDIKIYVLDGAGRIIADGSRYLAVVTHYNLVLNLSNGNGLALNGQASAIVLYFGVTEISRIAVTQPAPPPPCVRSEIRLSPIAITSSFKPPHDATNGQDGVFSCGRMSFFYEVSLRLQADKKAVIATIHMFGEECCHASFPSFNCTCNSNCQSQVNGTIEQVIYAPPQGAIIENILSPRYYISPSTYLEDSRDIKIGAGGDYPIDYIICNSPRSGEGVTGTITWKDIRVRICK